MMTVLCLIGLGMASAFVLGRCDIDVWNLALMALLITTVITGHIVIYHG